MGKKHKKRRAHPEAEHDSAGGSLTAGADSLAIDSEKPVSTPPAPANLPASESPVTATDSLVAAHDAQSDADLAPAVGRALPAAPAAVAATGGTGVSEHDPNRASAFTPQVGVPGPATVSGCLLHFAWRFYGPALLFAFAAAILVHNPSVGAYDSAYALFSILIVAARWWDDRTRGSDATAALPGEFRTFALRLLAGALLGWLLARVLGRMSS